MGHFLLFHPPNNPKNKNFKKMKKIPGDIIILHKCPKNHDHMLYWSWDMAHDGCNCYFSFWAIFCPFTPLTTRKMKILKTYKKTPWDIIILHKCTQNHDHMLYYSWDIARDRCKCSFFYFGLFLPFYSSKNQNFKKMKKVPGDIIILHMCTKNYD